MKWVADISMERSWLVKATAAGCAVALFSTNVPDAFGAGGRDAKLATVKGIAAYNKGDYALAFHLLQSAANQGDSDAEVNLGYMYARGQAVQADQAEALRLYRLSAESGNGEGMNAIAYKYTFGTGVPVDMKMAVRWYCRAIGLGNPRALTNLGSLHAKGQGIAVDMDEAVDLWHQAAAMGHANAMFDLGVTLVQMIGTPSHETEGKAWIIRAAQLGQPAAINWLRSNNYGGPLPQPIDTTGRMMLAPPKAPSGNAKECTVS
jgi:TPR repeat protein